MLLISLETHISAHSSSYVTVWRQLFSCFCIYYTFYIRKSRNENQIISIASAWSTNDTSQDETYCNHIKFPSIRSAKCSVESSQTAEPPPHLACCLKIIKIPICNAHTYIRKASGVGGGDRKSTAKGAKCYSTHALTSINAPGDQNTTDTVVFSSQTQEVST